MDKANVCLKGIDLRSILRNFFMVKEKCGGSKTWALAVGVSTTFYQQYVRGEETIREPRN